MQDSLRRFKADIFQALAHPTRIAILELLGEGELSAGALIYNEDEVAHRISFLHRELLVEVVKTFGGPDNCRLVAHSNYNIMVQLHQYS